MRHHRRFPVGAEVLPRGDVHFRLWALQPHRVEVVLEGEPGQRPGAAPTVVALDSEGNGYFSGQVADAAAGTLYRYRLDGEAERYADPASRFSLDGPHGPSQVIDPHTFPWHDQLADFPGRFGWGYDGVNLFAPTRLYGTPDDCRRFIDQAHALGMGVILDVVYNHIGPEGNVLPQFSPEYFTDRYSTDWGVAINYEDAQAGPVREYFLANIGYWIEEFHFDGLRIDATQNIYDTSADHILAALARRVRRAAAGRATLLAYTAGALILQYFDHDFPVAPQSGCVWVKTRQGCIMRHTIPHEPSAT